MKTIRVQASRNYVINIARGLLRLCSKLTVEVKKPCPTVLISDDTVYGIYGETVIASYEKAGFTVSSVVFPSGEQFKNFNTVEMILEYISESRIIRNDLIIALGGGVVGDIAGFTAAIYLRGIPYVQIPTTLLAAVDSSVGGKTGVNLKAGKNLAGSFNQPSAVFCDPDTFITLPENIFNDGLCEVIKYGCISDGELLDSLLNENIHDKLCDIIETSIKIKRNIVELDEFDQYER